MATSIKKNFSYNILSNISSVIFPFITAPYVSRVLGPEAIGLSGFAGAYVGYFTLVCGLGSGIYGQRKVAQLRDDKISLQKYMSEMLSISVIHTTILSILFVASVFILPKIYANYVIFLIAGMGLYLMPFNIFGLYFRGKERFGFIVSRNLILSVLLIICLFLFVKSESDLYLYMLLGTLSSFGVIFSNVFYLHKDGITLGLTRKGLLQHYKPMLTLFASTIAISVYTMLDKLMLGIMSSYSEVSFYGYATTINKTLLALATSMSAVTLPRMAYYFKDKDYEKINDLMSKSLSVVTFLAFPMAFGIICIAPAFMPIFLGKEFMASVIPTMIMSGVIIAIGLNNLLGIQVLIGLSLDKLFLYSVLVGTFSNFFLNLVLIPKWGASGAAAASVIAEFAILFIEIYFIKRYTQVRFGYGKSDIIKSLVGSLLFLPVAYLMYQHFSGWTYIGLIIATCICIYTLSQYLLKSRGYDMISNTLFQFIKKND